MTQSVLPTGQFAEVDAGYRIHYHDHGSGQAVVMLHGSGPGASGWSNFRRNYPYLVENGCRVVIPDLIGYGFSSKPDDVEYPLSFFVDCLKQTLDHLGLARYSLIGNSLGGAIAIQMALDYPDAVERLILMAPGAIEEREAYFKMKGITTMMGAFLSEEGMDEQKMAELLTLQLHDPKLVTEDIVKERMEVLKQQNRQCLATMQVPYLAPRLGELRCPILGFWGMEDQFCPVSGVQVMMERCSNIQFLVRSECGHWFMVEHAGLFNRSCLDFLRHS